MELSGNQQRIANKRRKIIQDNFVNVRLCNKCKGTGLGNFYKHDGDYSWDGTSFCDKCEGVGYLSWKETILVKLCPKCKGGGCETCNDKGVLDWVQYMRVGGKNGK